MAKTYSWSTNQEELRRLFTLTLNDHRFLLPLRADAQRLYRALVLVWARVERVLLSEANGIPDEVIHHVSKQLKVTPYLFVNAEPMLAVLSGENGGQKCWEPKDASQPLHVSARHEERFFFTEKCCGKHLATTSATQRRREALFL